MGTFYVGSTFVSLHNPAYYEFFSTNVPLAKSFIEYGETHGWDTLTVSDVVRSSSDLATSTYAFIVSTINGTPSPTKAIESAKPAGETKPSADQAPTFKIVKKTTEKVEAVKKPVVEKVKEEVKETKQAVEKVPAVLKEEAKEVVGKVIYSAEELVRRAEAAVAGKDYDAPASPPPAEELVQDGQSVYSAPLPLGFEPPPGYVRPAPPKPKAAPAPPAVEVVLPLVAPAVSSVSEPIVAHLAGTIDNLASYLKADPAAAAKAGDILETAKTDLNALVDRIEAVKEQERVTLEAKLDDQAREYTLKLLELEMEAQDKLDHQTEDFTKLFDQERNHLIATYREKLQHELQVQTELINERYVQTFSVNLPTDVMHLA